MDRKVHWDAIYTTKSPDEVSWFQASPELSLTLIAATGVGKDVRIIDVGGGASVLVDRLLDAGFSRLTVLDISAAALRRARERLGKRAGQVTWLEADITAGTLAGTFDVWHDRAVFHFLTDPEDRKQYLDAVDRAVPAGGHIIIAAFDPEGPPRCSGLEVQRYSPEALQQELGGRFELVETRQEIHTTPSKAQQAFLYCRFRKR